MSAPDTTPRDFARDPRRGDRIRLPCGDQVEVLHVGEDAIHYRQTDARRGESRHHFEPLAHWAGWLGRLAAVLLP